MKRLRTIALLLILALFASCVQQENTYTADDGTEPPDPSVLMEVDRAFSDHSVEKGFVDAFITYSDDNVVLLRENSVPIVGMEGLKERMNSLPDSIWTFSWEPSDAMIASSGDLGYTYGTWHLDIAADTPSTLEGTYVTIWKQAEDGSWKCLLDSGNEGLGN